MTVVRFCGGSPYHENASDVAEGLIETWNGTAWSVTLSLHGTDASYFEGVSCPLSTLCFAVGYAYNSSDVAQTLAYTLSEGSWSEYLSGDEGTGNNYLYGVSCKSVDCEAVGSYEDSSGVAQTLIESNEETNEFLPVSSADENDLTNVLNGVSCVNFDTCTAVGYYANSSGVAQTLVEVLDNSGNDWVIVTSPNEADSTSDVLNSVSCTSSSFCEAVGHFFLDDGFDSTLVESWNGTAWSIVSSPNASDDNNLASVWCTSSTDCVAVGDEASPAFTYTLIESWDGTSWTVTTSADPTMDNWLSGVSCTSFTDCVAVGYYENSSVLQTLVETGTFPAPTITTFSPTSGAPGTLVTIHGTNLEDSEFRHVRGSRSNDDHPGHCNQDQGEGSIRRSDRQDQGDHSWRNREERDEFHGHLRSSKSPNNPAATAAIATADAVASSNTASRHDQRVLSPPSTAKI